MLIPNILFLIPKRNTTVHSSHIQRNVIGGNCTVTLQKVKYSHFKQTLVGRKRHLLARRKHVCKMLMMAELEQLLV